VNVGKQISLVSWGGLLNSDMQMNGATQGTMPKEPDDHQKIKKNNSGYGI
jgi:hypothetical protein